MTGAVERNATAVGRGGRNSPGPALSAAHEPSLKSSQVDARKDTAAVQEDGSAGTFPARAREPLH